MAKTAYHHGNLREELLLLARAELRDQAPESVSLRELSRRLAVSSTAVYRHFRNREELLDTLAETGFRELQSALQLAVRGAVERSSLASVVAGYRTYATRNPGMMRVMFRPVLHGKQRHQSLERLSGECLAEFVRAAGERAGGKDPEAAIRIAVQAWATVHGLTQLHQAQALSALDQWMLPTELDIAGG